MNSIDRALPATRLIALRPLDGDNEAAVLREMTRCGALQRVSPGLDLRILATASEFDRRVQAGGEAMAFVIVARGDGTMLGFTSISTRREAPPSGIMGPIWARREVDAAGIARDAAFLLMQFGFETLGCRRLELLTEACDRTDRERLRQHGFRREGVLRSFDCGPDGEPRDIAMWSMLMSEWPRAKRRLEAASTAAIWPGYASLPRIMPP